MLQPPAATLKTVSSPGLTWAESSSQFVLWAAMKAPLILGVNWAQLASLPKLDPNYYALVTNEEIIAVNQDLSPQARLVHQAPSAAQQKATAAVLNVTLQTCDLSRADQRFEPGSTIGSIKLMGSQLCLEARQQQVFAVPCSSVSTDWSPLKQDEQISYAQVNGKACMQTQGIVYTMPSITQCIYTGPLPPPLSVIAQSPGLDVGIQMFVWGSKTNQLVSASRAGACLTVGNANLASDPVTGRAADWHGNNGTLDHEVWAGDLTSVSAGKKRRVIVLFNKGQMPETLTAPPEALGTLGVTSP
eukprot:UC1_evm1s1953